MEDFLKRNELLSKVNENKRFIRNNESIIYCLIKNGNVVYVGQSTEFLQRLAQHSRYKRGKFDSYAIIENLGVDCKYETLLKREAYYIKLLKPKLNRTFVGKRKNKKRKCKSRINIDTSEIRRLRY